MLVNDRCLGVLINFGPVGDVGDFNIRSFNIIPYTVDPTLNAPISIAGTANYPQTSDYVLTSTRILAGVWGFP